MLGFNLFNLSGGEPLEANEDAGVETLNVASDIQEVPKKEEDITVENEPEVEKPGPDLFKAIFLDSSDESESEQEDDKVEKNVVVEEDKDDKVILDSSLPKRKKIVQATGLFANVDFDALNKKPDQSFEIRESKPFSGSMPKPGPSTSEETKSSSDIYGPAKPVSTAVSGRTVGHFSSDTSDSDEWEEKPQKVKKQKLKKSSKKKSKKHKKGKKKKKKKRKRSTSSSDDSDSN